MTKGSRSGFIVLAYGILCALAVTHPPHGPGRGGVISVSSALPVAKPASRERKLVKGKARFDKPAEAQEYYRAKRAPVGETAVPVERYLSARRQMRNMSVYSTASDLMAPAGMTASAMQALSTWEERGPGNVGGRTRVLVIDPGNADVMYAGGVAGESGRRPTGAHLGRLSMT